MSEEMKTLLQSLVNAAFTQIGHLELQIKEYEELLSAEETARVMAQSTYENAPDTRVEGD